MEKIARQTFLGASLVFGVAGIAMVLAGGPDGEAANSQLVETLGKLIMICVFVILPSFAFLVASKYLNGKN
jgi:hypothetical protein